MTSTRFMQLYNRLLVPNGLIHLKSDSNFMFTYTCEMVKENGLKVHAMTTDLYADPNFEGDKILSIQTYYEQQWLSRGLTIKYVQFECNERSEWIEPEVEIEKDSYRSFGRNRS